ncbi:nuclear hormone receptor HR96 isoform X3 [Lingula anatina]|uniref:Nuclear hormone receptor HR96 isoform X3 n=1 Tax=Lingula anatina TaxID=7574 RepID=A0A1S3I3P0_LINAN|nr:nuclear hormone receptor HR96 isoform X3 [Lingula anatina]|eukprot:XP_013392882.1 nuclear hormone receptor HR96 isoform X3 [Lingula anatina]
MAESTFDDLPCSSIPTPPSSETESMMNMSASSPDDVRPQRVGSKRKIKNKEDKVCGVCGDSALGYNFDAITCESCKAFFRRNAFKEKELKCVFEMKCKIDVNTRRFCSYCRLQKCFAIGMRKDMILDEGEKKRRMEKLVQTRDKKKVPKTDIPVTQIKMEEPSSTSTCRLLSIPPPSSFAQDQTSNTRCLSDDELAFLTTLQANYDMSLGIVADEPLEEEYKTLDNLVNSTGRIIRRLITFAKKIVDFMTLSQETQIVLLKGTSINSIYIRSATLYDAVKDAWVSPRGVVSTSILKRTAGQILNRFQEDHVKICRKFKKLLGNDSTVLVILQVISLFSPEYVSLTNRAIISNIQDRYLTLLKHYFEAKFSYREARRMYPAVLSILDEMKMFTEEHGRVLLHVNVDEIEPILLEIFDIR